MQRSIETKNAFRQLDSPVAGADGGAGGRFIRESVYIYVYICMKKIG